MSSLGAVAKIFFFYNLKFLNITGNAWHFSYYVYINHGGLSQWGRSNRPRIRPGYCKKSERAMGVVQFALQRNYAKKIDPCRMLVWLGRRTVQNMVILSGQYTMLSGRPVQTGQVLFEFKFTTAQSEIIYVNVCKSL